MAKPPVRRDPAGGGRAIAVATQEHHSGPLPSPRTLAEYDRVVPGLAERVVVLMEDEAAHRRHLQTEVVTHNIRHEVSAQRFAFGLSLALIGLALAMTLMGASTAAAAFIGTALVGVVAAFIGNRAVRAKESLAKDD